MPGSPETIKSYLVGLGFSVDSTSERRYEDALKRTAVRVGQFSKTAVKDFTLVGGAFIAAASAVVAGTVTLMSNVAKQDLGFQIFARRMWMGADAAKKMKIATDALGYSLEDILWGPPELADRYRRLIQDETVLMKQLGGPEFEKRMYNLREIGFQFDRLGVKVQYFGMRLASDLVEKLFPDNKGGLEHFLERLNKWFEVNIPFFSYTISNTVGKIVTDVQKVFQVIESGIEKVTTGADKTIKDFEKNHPWLYSISGLSPNDNPAKRAVGNFMGYDVQGNDIRDTIAQDARKLGIPEALAFAIAGKESNMQAYPPPGKKGEIGTFQLMPDTIKSLREQGIITGDPSDPSQNIWGGLNWLLQKKGDRSWEEGIKRYNGSGPDADRYRDDVLRRWKGPSNSLPAAGTYNPTSYDMGGVSIYIQSPNATPEEIKKAVQEGIDAHVKLTATRSYAQRQGAYV
jgi:hypothetical protein